MVFMVDGLVVKNSCSFGGCGCGGWKLIVGNGLFGGKYLWLWFDLGLMVEGICRGWYEWVGKIIGA